MNIYSTESGKNENLGIDSSFAFIRYLIIKNKSWKHFNLIASMFFLLFKSVIFEKNVSLEDHELEQAFSDSKHRKKLLHKKSDLNLDHIIL